MEIFLAVCFAAATIAPLVAVILWLPVLYATPIAYLHWANAILVAVRFGFAVADCCWVSWRTTTTTQSSSAGLVSVVGSIRRLRSSNNNNHSTKLSPYNSQISFAVVTMRLFALLLTLFFASFAVLILFGASIFYKLEETVLSVLYFTLLCSFSFKLDWKRPPTMVPTAVVTSVIGVWLGAFVIPLDWHKDYQKWPIPIVLGSTFGSSIGHTLALLNWN